VDLVRVALAAVRAANLWNVDLQSEKVGKLNFVSSLNLKFDSRKFEDRFFHFPGVKSQELQVAAGNIDLSFTLALEIIQKSPITMMFFLNFTQK
jgi:hypothetical protein